MLGTKLDPGAASRCILVLGLLLSASASGSCSSTAQAPQVPGEGLVVTGVVLDSIDGQGVSGVDLHLRTMRQVSSWSRRAMKMDAIVRRSLRSRPAQTSPCAR
jgi:hypothetical protein